MIVLSKTQKTEKIKVLKAYDKMQSKTKRYPKSDRAKRIRSLIGKLEHEVKRGKVETEKDRVIERRKKREKSRQIERNKAVSRMKRKSSVAKRKRLKGFRLDDY